MSKDYEKQIEEAFIALLADNANLSSISKRRWRDASKSKKYPVILVHCSGVDAEAETPLGELMAANVEIAAQTYTPNDKKRASLDSVAAEIRDSIFVSNLVASLNSKAGSTLFIAAVGSKTAYEADTDNINTWQMTLECHIYT